MATSKITKGMSPEQFRRLPRAEQRVLVAKDVLDLIKKKKINVTAGRYFMTEGTTWDLNTSDDFFKSNRITCRACAIGSCIVSLANIRNNMTFNQLNKAGLFDTESKAVKYLNETFTKDQQILMEVAFEGMLRGNSSKLWTKKTENQKIKLAPYIVSIMTDMYFIQYEDILKRLMRNLIKNKGEFKIKPLPVSITGIQSVERDIECAVQRYVDNKRK